MTEHCFNGLLTLDENDLNRMNYIVTNLADSTHKSITDVLDRIYNSKNTINKLIRVVLKPYNSNDIFNAFQSLQITKDKFGTYSYHVGNFAIENALYNLIGTNIELTIEDYTDSTRNMNNLDIVSTTEDNSHDTSQQS